MRHSAGVLSICVVALGASPAWAVEHSAEAERRTQAVAVFPDIVPGAAPSAAFKDDKPAPGPDPSLELLSTNPYDAQLAAALAARNLYGDELENPYTDEVRFANPYSEDLQFQNPYASRATLARQGPATIEFANPYTAALGSAPPRASSPRPSNAVPPASPLIAAPGSLVVDAAGFSGAIFVDGMGVTAFGVALPVLPGYHTVTVYPYGAAPYAIPVQVYPGMQQRLRLGR